jgi:hypothetical protein
MSDPNTEILKAPSANRWNILVLSLTAAPPGVPALSRPNITVDPNASAEFTITDTVLRPRDKLPELAANCWGGVGAVEWAANNFVRNSGNEPIYWRDLHRVMKCGPNWFEIDDPGTSWWDLRASGFLSGADLRINRLVDKAGKSLPLNKEGNYPDVSTGPPPRGVGPLSVHLRRRPARQSHLRQRRIDRPAGGRLPAHRLGDGHHGTAHWCAKRSVPEVILPHK